MSIFNERGLTFILYCDNYFISRHYLISIIESLAMYLFPFIYNYQFSSTQFINNRVNSGNFSNFLFR